MKEENERAEIRPTHRTDSARARGSTSGINKVSTERVVVVFSPLRFHSNPFIRRFPRLLARGRRTVQRVFDARYDEFFAWQSRDFEPRSRALGVRVYAYRETSNGGKKNGNG